MENLLPIQSNYLIILLVEVSLFSIFVYLVFSKTKDDVCRRWKASVFVSVIFGIFIQTILLGLSAVGWLMQVNFATLIDSFIKGFYALIPAWIGMEALLTMPIIILGTFIAYFRFWNSGDRLIEKYWRNPKIHYGQNQKPPFLKF
jgi:hypothetical protein